MHRLRDAAGERLLRRDVARVGRVGRAPRRGVVTNMDAVDVLADIVGDDPHSFVMSGALDLRLVHVPQDLIRDGYVR